MNYLKLSEGLDVSQILKELEQAPHLWNQIDSRTNFKESPHYNSKDIWLRYAPQELFKVIDRYQPFIPEWYESSEELPSCVDFSLELMKAVEGEMLGGVLITQVPPKGKILPHIDESWHVDYFDKFYLHLESNDDVEFCWRDGIKIKPKAGELYWLDNTKEHWVNNDGDTPRTTLIVCIKPFIRMKSRFGGV